MIMSIQRYPLHVQYRPGKELLIADTLSRAPPCEEANELEFRQYDINILDTLSITEAKLQDFKKRTRNDPALCELTQTIHNGWPQCKDRSKTHHGLL
jgi:hypothetical protein